MGKWMNKRVTAQYFFLHLHFDRERELNVKRSFGCLQFVSIVSANVLECWRTVKFISVVCTLALCTPQSKWVLEFSALVMQLKMPTRKLHQFGESLFRRYIWRIHKDAYNKAGSTKNVQKRSFGSFIQNISTPAYTPRELVFFLNPFILRKK